MKLQLSILLIFIMGLSVTLLAQSSSKDSVHTIVTSNKKDSAHIRKHIPRIATRRSLIIPGWGQAYNREYWKIPLVYGALAIPTSTFIFNNKYYKITKFAYEALYAAKMNNDTSQLHNINPEIQAGVRSGAYDLATLQNARNQYRKNRDFSIFWFIIIWGVNVADATVFGHLKDFDISNDLSLHVEPSFNTVTNSPGISLVFNFKNNSHKTKLATAK